MQQYVQKSSAAEASVCWKDFNMSNQERKYQSKEYKKMRPNRTYPNMLPFIKVFLIPISFSIKFRFMIPDRAEVNMVDTLNPFPQTDAF